MHAIFGIQHIFMFIVILVKQLDRINENRCSNANDSILTISWARKEEKNPRILHHMEEVKWYALHVMKNTKYYSREIEQKDEREKKLYQEACRDNNNNACNALIKYD